MNHLENLVSWYKKLSNEGYIQNTLASVRNGDRIAFLSASAERSSEELNVSDILELPLKKASNKDVVFDYKVHARIYQANPECNAIFHSIAPFTIATSNSKEPLKPALDDFAQMAGGDVRCLARKQLNSKKLNRALIMRTAVLVRNAGALCASFDLDDAYAVAKVIEKNSKAVVESSFIGGCEYVSPVESWLMRVVYKYKYSKIKLENS